MKRKTALFSSIIAFFAIFASCSQTDGLLDNGSTISSRNGQATFYYKTIVDTAKTLTVKRAAEIALQLPTTIQKKECIHKCKINSYD